jgi:RsiW-degrading membrane proteinase PrsW (M82 family)
MNFSVLQLAVAISVPILFTGIVWCCCRRWVGLGTVALSFLLGALSVWPVIRLSNFTAIRFAGLTGHYYLDEWIQAALVAATPEEIGKGLAALLVVRLVGTPRSPLAWLACGAAAHSGFAALEGVLSALGNEGILKVLVGRSLGALSHGSSGIIMLWFGWRGWARHGDRRWNWAAALLVPVLLHATFNASLVDVPGATNLPDGTMPPLAAIMIVLSGMAVTVASVVLACWCLFRSRRMDAAAGRGSCPSS